MPVAKALRATAGGAGQPQLTGNARGWKMEFRVAGWGSAVRGRPATGTIYVRPKMADGGELLKRWGIPHKQRHGAPLVARDHAQACVERIVKTGCRFYGYDAFIVADETIQPVLEFSPDWSRGPVPSLSELVSEFASHPEAITHYEFVFEASR